MVRRKASEISKAELVEMIRRLQRVVSAVAFCGPPSVFDYANMEAVLSSTDFDNDLEEVDGDGKEEGTGGDMV
jgi:hypothetical protein